MNILVTGGSGMVGKNLLEHPIARDFNILAPSSRQLNLLSLSEVTSFVNTEKPDIIVHCAGTVGGIQANIREPYRFLYENAVMGLNLVNAAKESGIKKLLNLGSSCMYPKDFKNPLKEEYILQAPLEPTNEGYALAKILTAKLCEYSNRENDAQMFKTVIPCNLYGRWDKFSATHSHMIPAVVRKIHEAKVAGADQVEIWGDGTARREFMYVEDLIDFLFFAITKFEELPEYCNVGLGCDYSINEYYDCIKKVVGYAGNFTHNLEKPVGMKQKLVSVDSANQFGWSAKTSLEDGIRKTYEFFLNEVKND